MNDLIREAISSAYKKNVEGLYNTFITSTISANMSNDPAALEDAEKKFKEGLQLFTGLYEKAKTIAGI